MDDPYSALSLNDSIGVLALDPDNRVVAISGSWLSLLGRPSGAVLGASLFDLGIRVGGAALGPEFVEDVRLGRRAKLSEGQMEIDGRSVPCDVALSSLLVRGGVGVCLAIPSCAPGNPANRAQARSLLAQAEDRFRAIFENGPVGLTTTDVQGRLIACNPAFAQMLGYEVSELLGKSFAEYMHPEDSAAHLLLHMEMVEGKRDRVQVETRVRRKDGRTIWVRSTGAITRNDNPRNSFVVSTVEDVTERRQLDDVRRSERGRLWNILQTAQEGFCMFDRESRIIEVNEAYCWMSGYSREELLGMSISDLDVQESPDEVLRHLRRINAAESDSFETRHHRKDGRIMDVEVNARSLGDEGVIFAFMRDVTERNMMEKALRESERRYRTLFDSTSDGLLIHNLGGRMLEANSVFCQRLGYSRGELLHMSVGEIAPSERASQMLLRLRELAQSGSAVYETTHRARSGALIPIEVSSRVIDYEGQKAIFSICRDITERKQLQEQLNRAQRLETAGRVAGQVAHDFNNLLGPMAAYPDLIKMELPEGHRALMYCEEMSKAAHIMAEINSDMLVLSRRGLLKEEPVDVNQTVRQVLRAAGTFPDTLHVDLRLSDDLPPVSGSSSQLLRVVSNLISNGREAMHDRGELTIETLNVSVDMPFGEYDRVEPGQYVRLVVRDTGCGIPPEIKERVFDPFFSTKKADKRRGSGLGLAIVHSVVEDHKGYIDVDTEVGVGTSFSVYLPVYTGASPRAAKTLLPGGNETILVVDDDPLQRTLARTLLGQVGYVVETVSAGEDAVAYLENHSADLVLLDMTMEDGIDGAETYRRIIRLKPAQKAIIMSGYAESERFSVARSLGIGTFLTKPLTSESLAKAVRQELDSNR